MNRLSLVIVTLLITVLLLAACGGSTTSEPTTTTQTPTADIGTEIDKLAPDFQLQDFEGQTVTLSNLRGNPVILNFWASWCGPCKHEMPFLQQIYEDWQSRGVILLSINLGESHSKATQYMESNDLSFPVLLDTDGEVSSFYNIVGIPTTFFIDVNGVIQAKKLGSFNSVIEIESQISIIQS